ncbi:alpha/beta hydrolase [Actinoplanes sp. HUAS TT8]|uniref:alpha/beta hydrolase n=1 Tax=Actinoplanes sp. HUAS TT8 TaxID=3447453 RepID=UPI003F528C31
MIADEQLAAFLRAATAQPATESDIPTLRAAGRARAATRPPGPAMPAKDTTVAGVAVRSYQPGAATVIVHLHGGGFVLGDLDTHDPQARRLAAATGATVVAVDYRRAPEHPWPAAVDDATTVITALAAEHARIAVAGDSAGGLIAILAALRLRGEVPLVAQLLVCPNADPTLRSPSVTEKGQGWLLDPGTLREWIARWLPDATTHDSPMVNPLAADLRGLPPALVVTSEHDPLRDEGDAYAARLRDAGVPVTHRREPGLIHNFPSLRHVSPACAAAEDRFLADAAALLTRTNDAARLLGQQDRGGATG